jgi:hypothetical protein
MKFSFVCKWVSSAFVVVGLNAVSMSLKAETPQRNLSVDQACPVKMTNMKLHSSKVTFRYQNVVHKEIAGIEFGAAYYDSVQEPHRVTVTGGWKGLKAYYQRDSGLDISYWKTTGYAGWTLWPTKILYKDGSRWESGAKNGCGIEAWNEKQLHPMYTAEQIMMAPADEVAMATSGDQ